MTTQIQEYSKTEAALNDLRSRFNGVIFDVTTTAGDKAARAARQEVKGYRTSLETMRKEIKAPALERCRLIDDEAKRITAELLALEEPIDEQIKAEETRKAAEKAERDRIEKERVDVIQAKIANIRSIPAQFVGASSVDIQVAIDTTAVSEILIDEFAELTGEAMQAKAQTISALADLLTKAQAQEAEQARIIAERAELEELRKAAAERDRVAAQERAAAEKKAKEEHEAYAAKILAAQAAQEAEQRRIAQEQAAVQAEIDRQRQELAEQQEAAARAEAERLELIEQQQRQAEETERLRLEAIERDKQEKAEAKAAEKRAKDERKAREQFMQTGPDQKEIIALIASHYDVSEQIAINWLARHEFGELIAA